MGRIFKSYIEAQSVYVCNQCATHVVSTDDIVNKQFQGRHGKAYLFDNVVNISLGPVEERVCLRVFFCRRKDPPFKVTKVSEFL